MTHDDGYDGYMDAFFNEQHQRIEVEDKLRDQLEINKKLLEACKEMWLIMEEHPIYRAHASRLAGVRAAIAAAEGEME